MTYEHTKESSLPFGLGPDIHTVTIKTDGKIYEGVASSRSEAERNAEINKGCDYSVGEYDDEDD